MRPQRLGLAVMAVAAVGLVCSLTVWSAHTREVESGFVEEGQGPVPLVDDARGEGLRTLRVLSGPQAIMADPLIVPSSTVLAVVGPLRPYSEADAAAVRRFVEAGGQLLVAENFGYANSLTGGLGVTFERVRLASETVEIVSVVMDRRMFVVEMPTPTAIRVAPDVPHRVVGSSSSTSFLDRDGDGVISAGEPLGPFPLAVVFEVGSLGGRVLAVADPSPFLPGAVSEDDRRFRVGVLQSLLPEGGRVLVDESRSSTPDPWLMTASQVVGAAAVAPWRVALAVLSVLTFVVAATFVARRAWNGHRFDAMYYVRRAELSEDATSDGDGTPASSTTARWTRRGHMAIFGGVALAVLGLVVGSFQATYAASFILVAGAMATLTAPVHLRTERSVSAVQTQEDATVDVELRLTARRRGPRRVEVLDALPREFALVEGDNWFATRLGGRAECRVKYQVRPAVRGPYSVGPVRARSSDAFGLRTVETTGSARERIRVEPRHDALGRIPFKSKIPQVTLGPHLVSRSGDGAEFHSMRDYQAGDPIRSVNWRASARTKGLIVNQRVHESMATITVLIDSRAPAAAGPARHAPIHEACRGALSIATGALRARDKVRIFTYGEGVRELAPHQGPERLHELRTQFSDLAAGGLTTLLEAVDKVLPRLKPRSPLVLLSGFEEDPTVVEAMMKMRGHGAMPTVIALAIGTRPVEGEAEPGEPDEDRLQAERENTISGLAGAGIPVVSATPGVPLSVLLRLGVP